MIWKTFLQTWLDRNKISENNPVLGLEQYCTYITTLEMWYDSYHNTLQLNENLKFIQFVNMLQHGRSDFIIEPF